MGDNEAKPKKKSRIWIVIVLVVLVIALIAFTIYLIINQIRSGWTNNDTFQFVFFAFVVLFVPVSCKSFLDYFVAKDKRLLFLNNDIHRHYAFLEKEGLLSEYEKAEVSKERDALLTSINQIVSKNNKDVVISLENINEFYNPKYNLLICDLKLNIFQRYFLRKKCCDVTSNKSKRFEELYRSYHSGELLERKKFPIFEFIIPLIFTAAGMFATVYESLSVNGTINDSLFEYLKLFLLFVLVGFSFALHAIEPTRNSIHKSKIELLDSLESIVNKHKS